MPLHNMASSFSLKCRACCAVLPTPAACTSRGQRLFPASSHQFPSLTVISPTRRPPSEAKPHAVRFSRLVANSSKYEAPPWSEPGYKGAAVSRLPEVAQAGVVASIFAALGVATTASCTLLGPTLASSLPEFYAFSKSTWPLLGLTYLAAGVAHFGVEQGFLDMYPHRGAWGIWFLPGSPSFHVRWTGVAEVAGGAGLLLGALHLPFLPEWLESGSALGLFALSWAVYPANIYMFTHNAPGPVPEGKELPVITWQGHLIRGLLQVFLLSILWGIATQE